VGKSEMAQSKGMYPSSYSGHCIKAYSDKVAFCFDKKLSWPFSCLVFKSQNHMRPNKKNPVFSSESFDYVNVTCAFFFCFCTVQESQPTSQFCYRADRQKHNFFPIHFYISKNKKKLMRHLSWNAGVNEKPGFFMFGLI